MIKHDYARGIIEGVNLSRLVCDSMISRIELRLFGIICQFNVKLALWHLVSIFLGLICVNFV